MRPMMMQSQLLGTPEVFRRPLVCGSAGDALALLSQTGPGIGGPDPVVTWLDPVSAKPDTPTLLDRLVAALERRGVHLVHECAPLDQTGLLRRLADDRHDIVMKALARRHAADGMAPDRTDTALVESAPCRVWLGDRARQRPPCRVLAAVDPLGPGPDAGRLAGEVLAQADAIARQLGADLHVAQCWQLHGADLLRRRMRARELHAHVAEAGRAAARALADLLSGASHPPALSADQIHLIEGDSAYELPHLVRSLDVGLAVVSTRGRRRWPARALITPHALAILEGAACSVMVVR